MTLQEIQKNLKAPKNQKNTFGNYRYRSCEDILEAVKPLLGDAILTISDKIVAVGDRVYVEATVIFKDDKCAVEVTAYAREQETKKGMDEAQITGAASSYARKYALNGLFLIDDTKDADTQKPADNEPARTYEDRKADFVRLCKKHNLDIVGMDELVIKANTTKTSAINHDIKYMLANEAMFNRLKSQIEENVYHNMLEREANK